MHDINEIKGIPSYTYPSCLKKKTNKQTKKQIQTNKEKTRDLYIP